MRATRSQLDRYVRNVAGKLWSFGAELDGGPELLDDGVALQFEVRASLPDSGIPQQALLRVTESWRSRGAEWERGEYAYDLIDHPRSRRRAFHLHDKDLFAAAYDVLVHQHCEEELGSAECEHYLGDPVPDAYRGVELLLLTWTDDALGLDGLQCAERD